MITADLFTFAYVPVWYEQLENLSELALPEPWKFSDTSYYYKNTSVPILERYIQSVFRKAAIDYSGESDAIIKNRYFHITNEYASFHTGLYTRQYKPIYGVFEKNKRPATLQEWYFRGFSDESNSILKYIEPLPQKPSYYMPQQGVNYSPDWNIRVNVNHILGDPANIERIPEDLREAKNLPLLLETAVELARRKAVVEPSLVAPQGYMNRVQYLLPICLTDMEHPDLAMTLSIMDGYYLGNTCLTLEMAYLNARLLSRPCAAWLTELLG